MHRQLMQTYQTVEITSIANTLYYSHYWHDVKNMPSNFYDTPQSAYNNLMTLNREFR
jgi:hypothetical protein